MKLHSLIKTNNWLSVELTLLKLYPDQNISVEAYKKVFEKLESLTPEENQMQIVLSEEYDFADEEKEETYIDVLG